jgi:hypothetical protein
VLLRAHVSEPDALTRRGRAAARMRLADHGHTVVWSLGDTTTTWTLPDQPRCDGVPVLTTVERAETWRTGARGVVLPESYLLLVADDGVPLARLARVSTFDPDLYSEKDVARLWPDSAFDPLLARGVVRRTTTYPDLAALQAARPGAVPLSRSVTLTGRQIALLWAAALAVLVVVLAARHHR